MFGVEPAIVTPAPEKKREPSSGAAMSELLVRVAVAEDRNAFAELYSFFAPRVKGYLIRGGASPDLADDLAQETLLKVWRKAKLFDPAKAAAATWIFTIARNLRIDAARRASKPALDGEDPALAPEPEPQADDVIERNDRDARIRATFKLLPDNQHEVVKLHFLEDAPHSEIAEKLGLPLGTVKSRLRLAFGKIRKELGELDA
ncbi:MAG: sigma-70 family RNA polymerase sigma factor [Pseudomonadota bacterium]